MRCAIDGCPTEVDPDAGDVNVAGIGVVCTEHEAMLGSGDWRVRVDAETGAVRLEPNG